MTTNTNTDSFDVTYAQAYPLHNAVIKGNAEEVEAVILASKGAPLSEWCKRGVQQSMRRPKEEDQRQLEAFLNHRDWNGNPPLHLAVHFRHKDIIELLIKHGADPLSRNGGGYSVMQETIPSGDVKVAESVYDAVMKSATQEYNARAPEIFEHLKELPDFTCELKWEMRTWVPLLSMVLPQDNFILSKRGSSFRMDFTLTGMKSLRWQRGEISILLRGDVNDINDSVALLDRKNKIIQYLGTADIKPKNIKDILSRKEIRRADVDTSQIRFEPSQSWFSGPIFEEVSGYNTQVYEVDGFKLKIKSRSRDVTDDEPSAQLDAEYFVSKPITGKGEGLLYTTETFKVTERDFKSTVHLTNSSFDIASIFPMLAAVLPRPKHFERVRQVLSHMPPNTLPVKIDVPVFPTIAANFAVLNFELKTPDAELYKVGEEYTCGKVEFHFEAAKKAGDAAGSTEESGDALTENKTN